MVLAATTAVNVMKLVNGIQRAGFCHASGLLLTRELALAIKRRITPTAGLHAPTLHLGTRCFMETTLKRQASLCSSHETVRSENTDLRGEDHSHATRVAREVFRIEKLRPEQEDAIARVTAGKNTLVSGPFRSGRSLCHLVPAIIAKERCAKPQLTVVFGPSPQSFRDHSQDQSLKGVCSVDYRCAHADARNRKQMFAALRNGKAQVLNVPLYAAHSKTLLNFVKDFPGGIRQIVIEEADRISHPESRWRELYEIAARFVKECHPRSLLCTTDQDSDEVIRKICDSYMIEQRDVVRFSKTLPSALELRVLPISRTHDKYYSTLELLDARPGRTIIYTYTGGEDQLSQKLQQDMQDATAVQELPDDSPVSDQAKYESASQPTAPTQRIICTGLNGAQRLGGMEFRHAIFQALPRSIENLFRASRVVTANGKAGRCTVLLSTEEIYQRTNQDAARRPSILASQGLVQDIFAQTPMAFRRRRDLSGPAVAVRHEALARKYQINVEQIFFLYDVLSKKGYSHYFKEKEAVVSDYKILKDSAEMVGDQQLRTSILNYLLKHGRTGKYDLFKLSDALGTDLPLLIQGIRGLETQRVLKLAPREWLSLLEPRAQPSNAEMDEVALDFHVHLAEESDRRISATQDIVRIFTAERCAMVSMAEAVGAQMPGGASECGRCTFCVKGQPVVLPRVKPKRVDEDKVQAIYDEFAEFRHDPRILTRIALGIKLIGVEEDRELSSKTSWQNPLVGSMRFCKFEELLEKFAIKCCIPKDKLANC